MPIDPNLMIFPQPDIGGAFLRGTEMREARLRNRLLEMKLAESKEAQDFFKSLMEGQAAPQGPSQGAAVATGEPANQLGTAFGGGTVPGQINWSQLALDPRVQMNPIVAERVQNMVNLQVQAQNAAANQIKTSLEVQEATREAATRKTLISELTTAGRSPTDIQAVLQMLDSKNPDALAMATAAVEQPGVPISELRRDIRATRLGGVQEQTIQDIMQRAQAEGRPITREQAHIQDKKTQAVAQAEGTREAEKNFIESSLGPEGLRLWGAQSLFLGKDPGIRNPAVATMVKNEEAKIIRRLVN